MRTGWCKPAFWAKQRRNYPLIQFYQDNEWQAKYVFNLLHQKI